MQLTSLLPVAALALTANAFLVPPEVSDASLKIGQPDAAAAIAASKQSIELDCQDCKAALGKDAIVGYKAAVKGMKMGITMDFEVRPDEHELLLNGARVFPPANPRGPPVLYTAKQTVSGASEDFYAGSMPLSLSIELQGNELVRASDGSLLIHRMSIEPIGLGQSPVHVPTIQVRLAQLPNGKLMLLPLQTTPYKHHPLADSCTSIFCRVRAVIAIKMAAFRAKIAAAKAPTLASIGAVRGCIRKFLGLKPIPVHPIGMPKRPHRGGHHHHHHHGGFGAATVRMVHHVLLPIFLGILTGAFAGAVGVILFAAVRALVRRARGSHQYAMVHTDEAEEGRASAELPKYEDVSRPYVEADEDADEKKELLPEPRK